MNKWIIGLAAVLLLGFAGYKWGTGYLADRMVLQVADQLLPPSEIEKLKNDPEVKKAIEQHFTAEQVEKIYAGRTAPAASSAPAAGGAGQAADIMSKDEAVQLLMRKYSLGEIKALAEKAGDGLTETEKAEIERQFSSKFTPEERERLQLAALMELMRQEAR